MPETESYIAAETDAGDRMDRFLCDQEPEITRSHFQKLLKDGLVSLNGKPAKASSKLNPGDLVEVVYPDPEPLEILPENIPLSILYEDEDILVVDKPRGMVVHPAAGHTNGTLVNAVMYHCGDSLSGINGVMRPGIVHRIDKDTSGSLLICKTDAAHRSIAEQLAVHSIRRVYHAIAGGHFKDPEGTVDAPIGRHPTDRKKMAVNHANGKPAVTHYRVMEELKDASFIECRLETGRTHQIRVHMKSIGHPLLGDPVYGPAKDPYHLNGQALHAKILGFVHPTRGVYMEFDAPYPPYMIELVQKLRK